jgi:hypothetical protein
LFPAFAKANHTRSQRDCIAHPKHPEHAGFDEGNAESASALRLDASARAASGCIRTQDWRHGTSLAVDRDANERRITRNVHSGAGSRRKPYLPGARGTAVAYAGDALRCAVPGQ